jgi:hypothetical protein
MGVDSEGGARSDWKTVGAPFSSGSDKFRKKDLFFRSFFERTANSLFYGNSVLQIIQYMIFSCLSPGPMLDQDRGRVNVTLLSLMILDPFSYLQRSGFENVGMDKGDTSRLRERSDVFMQTSFEGC